MGKGHKRWRTYSESLLWILIFRRVDKMTRQQNWSVKECYSFCWFGKNVGFSLWNHSLWSLFATMSRTCCSICKFSYDPENYAEVAHHNSLCSMMARGMLLEKKIEDEKKKFKALHQKESHRSKRTVREFRLPLSSAGAYSSSILCGITSDQLSTSNNSNSIGSAHLKSRFSSTKRRKLIDDLNKEKIHNEKGSNTNDKQWLQLDSEYEVAIIPNGSQTCVSPNRRSPVLNLQRFFHL